MITLAPVEAAKNLDIPVVHITTDFLPICRQATFIRWNGHSCNVGETIKSCAECFLSHRALGRIGSSLFNKISEKTLVRRADQAPYKLPHPLWLFNPYWKQVNIMIERLKILTPLRKKIDLVLAPNQYILNAFTSNGFSRQQVHFLPFAVESNNMLAKLKHTQTPHLRFLFIGRFQPYKGAHLLIDAFNNLKNPNNATLTIYGAADNGYLPYFKRLESAMASNDRIFFKGTIAPADLHQAFAEADYFVLPSTWHENSPLIVLDALQSKTPLIASNIGGITDTVKDGVNGLLFQRGSVQSLQQALQKAIDHPDLLEKLRADPNLMDIDDYAITMLKLCQKRQLLDNETDG